MNLNLVSIIIPAYNAAKYIERTIRSVLNQEHSNLEIIVIDDGSTDNTSNIVKQFSARDKRLKYIYQKNAGVSAARNHGFKVSKGDILGFLDADDIWLPDNVSKKVEHLHSNPDTGLVHSDALLIDEHDNSLKKVIKGKSGWLLNDLLLWDGTCIPSPGSILVRREVVENTKGFDTDLSTSADQEFFFRVAAHYKIGRIPEVTWQYRIHSQNMHSDIALMERDSLMTYKKATEYNLYKSKAFRRKCYSNMYLILSGSWYNDGKNKRKAISYAFKSVCIYPAAIFKLLRKTSVIRSTISGRTPAQ